jgi:hypothetical protein
VIRGTEEVRRGGNSAQRFKKGWGENTRSAVERGERNVSILNLRLIARVLRVELSEVFGEKAESEE